MDLGIDLARGLRLLRRTSLYLTFLLFYFFAMFRVNQGGLRTRTIPGPSSRSSVLCRSYPSKRHQPESKFAGSAPLVLDLPPECAAAWLRAHHAWIDLAKEPVKIQGRTQAGKCRYILSLGYSTVLLYYRTT